ncbi:hypothetical protein PoB_002631800 [Plakobranchus ocellatus]|uniref:Uncharacterized protein n=1 Tax=Plakobranchus ocellatus TaxID=259542 RepID=A0AAV3ZY45_9GAST|nr:hypothetical protein PoB_002631800 [Plakobranchus ocellatus]
MPWVWCGSSHEDAGIHSVYHFWECWLLGRKVLSCQIGLSSPDASNTGDSGVQQCGVGKLAIPTIVTWKHDLMVGWELGPAPPFAKFHCIRFLIFIFFTKLT